MQYKTEYHFIQYFFKYFFKAKQIYGINNTELIKLKRLFNKEILILLGNPIYTIKEKCMWILFFINDKYYYSRITKRGCINE